MTCIAIDSKGTMAADTQLTGGSGTCRASKLVRLTDGGVAGGCGDWAAAWAGLRFLALDGNEESDRLPDIKGATILIARPDGMGGWSLSMLEDRFPAFPILDKYAAVGCGSEAALMALRLGLSAVEAVLQVTKQDAFCGDPVQAMAVEATHEYSALQTFVERPKAVRKATKKKPRRK